MLRRPDRPAARPGRDHFAEGHIERHGVLSGEANVQLNESRGRRSIVAPEVQPGFEGVHVDDGRDMARRQRLGDCAVHQRAGALEIAKMP